MNIFILFGIYHWLSDNHTSNTLKTRTKSKLSLEKRWLHSYSRFCNFTLPVNTAIWTWKMFVVWMTQKALPSPTSLRCISSQAQTACTRNTHFLPPLVLRSLSESPLTSGLEVFKQKDNSALSSPVMWLKALDILHHLQQAPKSCQRRGCCSKHPLSWWHSQHWPHPLLGLWNSASTSTALTLCH